MALKIRFTVGNDTFEAEGDFALDDGLLKTVQAWARALGPIAGQYDVDALTTRLRAQNDALAQSVAAQPTT
jgi:hypothetical protein